MMNAEQIWGIVRTILAAIAGWAAGQGYIDSETSMAIIGAVGTIFVAVWSWVAKRNAKKTLPSE
jgi:predicted amino acid dehydrogenase